MDTPFLLSRSLGLRGAFGCLALALLGDAFRKVAGVPELAYRCVLRLGFNNAGAFLSTRIQRDVVKSGHREEKFEFRGPSK